MAKDEPTEQYTPTGLKIPVPTRGEFDRNLDRLLKAPPPGSHYRKKPKPSPGGAAGTGKE
jgi:hypothetical protein